VLRIRSKFVVVSGFQQHASDRRFWDPLAASSLVPEIPAHYVGRRP